MTDPHKNYRGDWQTSPEWAEWIRRTLGAIDLDPASSKDANKTIKASKYYSSGGYERPWPGRVYCNPEGSNSVRSVKPWWEHGINELRSGRCTGLVWCFFNAMASYTLKPMPWELDGYMIIPPRRVPFWRDGKPFSSPRNHALWWSSVRPCAPPPNKALIVHTGRAYI